MVLFMVGSICEQIICNKERRKKIFHTIKLKIHNQSNVLYEKNVLQTNTHNKLDTVFIFVFISKQTVVFVFFSLR